MVLLKITLSTNERSALEVASMLSDASGSIMHKEKQEYACSLSVITATPDPFIPSYSHGHLKPF